MAGVCGSRCMAAWKLTALALGAEKLQKCGRFLCGALARFLESLGHDQPVF